MQCPAPIVVGLGIFRLQGSRLPVALDRLVEAVERRQYPPELVIGLRPLREQLDRRRNLAALIGGDAEKILRFGVVRVPLQGLTVKLRGPIKASRLMMDKAGVYRACNPPATGTPLGRAGGHACLRLHGRPSR